MVFIVGIGFLKKLHILNSLKKNYFFTMTIIFSKLKLFFKTHLNDINKNHEFLL